LRVRADSALCREHSAGIFLASLLKKPTRRW
jgi:hypothetical protein